MSEPSLAILLVEDEPQKRLLFRCLRETLQPRQIRVLTSPPGRGSAEDWVRRQFPIEVSAYRIRAAITSLIVVIDADRHTVQHRRGQLDQALKESNQYAIGTDERIARLIPKRNIETWIICLNQNVVDEQTDYKDREDNWDLLIPQAAEELLKANSQSKMPSYFVDSLRSGVDELKRLRP